MSARADNNSATLWLWSARARSAFQDSNIDSDNKTVYDNDT